MLRVLDSTVLIDFLRGRPAVGRVAALRACGDVPATTAINVEEIVRGLRAAETEVARRLFAGLVVLPIDGRAGWQAGTWRREFANRGKALLSGGSHRTDPPCDVGDREPEGLPDDRDHGRPLAGRRLRQTDSRCTPVEMQPRLSGSERGTRHGS